MKALNTKRTISLHTGDAELMDNLVATAMAPEMANVKKRNHVETLLSVKGCTLKGYLQYEPASFPATHGKYRVSKLQGTFIVTD